MFSVSICDDTKSNHIWNKVKQNLLPLSVNLIDNKFDPH